MMNWFAHLMRFTATAAIAAAMAAPLVSQAQQAADPQQPGAAQPPATQPPAAQPAAAQPADGQPAAAAGDPNAQPSAEQPQPAARKLEIIELQHRDPQQLTQLLGLWDEVAVPSYGGRGRVAVQRPSLQDQPGQRLAIALDNERKLMFVRGTAEQIEKVKALVAAIDVADDAVKPQDFADHRLIPIPSDRSGQIQSTLTQLDLAGQLLRVGDTTFIAYRTDDEDGERRKQAEQVINKLTAPPPAEGQPAEGQPAAQPAQTPPAAAPPATPPAAAPPAAGGA